MHSSHPEIPCMSLQFCFLAILIWNITKVVFFVSVVVVCLCYKAQSMKVNWRVQWDCAEGQHGREGTVVRANGPPRETCRRWSKKDLPREPKVNEIKNMSKTLPQTEIYSVSKRQIRQCYCKWAFISAARKNKKFYIRVQHYFYIALDNSCLSY